jgi:predicted ATPase
MTARIKKEQLPEPLKVRLKSLHIENYKCIDNLEIQFQGPKLASDPHVTVIGSENGLGKTSILECCALLFLSLSDRKEFSEWWSVIDFMRYTDVFIDPIQLMVRAGAKFAKIRGTFSFPGAEPFTVSLTCEQERISVEPYSRPQQLSSIFEHTKRIEHREQRTAMLLSLLGIIGEPMVFPPFLYFNSYRKIQEGSPEMAMMLSGERHHWRRPYGPDFYSPISAFKIEIIRALMGRQGLFESVNEVEAEAVVQELNALITDYAHGTLAKLREFEGRALELRINPKNRKSSYPFDGLSSGQKEIISTLFLIWKYTRKQPGIVLIDEPELHLNAEWHRGFIRRLSKLQPLNQYIIATHSEHVFDSVDEGNRLLLEPTKK